MERSEEVEQMPGLDGEPWHFDKDLIGSQTREWDEIDRSGWQYAKACAHLNKFFWRNCVRGKHSMSPFARGLRDMSYTPRPVLEIGIRHMHSTVPLLLGKLDFLYDHWTTPEAEETQPVYSCDIESLPNHKWLQDLLPQLWVPEYKRSTSWHPPTGAGALIVDGHHTYTQVKAELEHLGDHLEEGSLIFFHDTITFGSVGGGLGHQMKGKDLGIRPAIDEWMIAQAEQDKPWHLEAVYAQEPGALVIHRGSQ